MSENFVIVGAGFAGAKAVEALREEGHDGPIVLLGDEPERPYERPPLSKGFLQGEDERESVFVHCARSSIRRRSRSASSRPPASWSSARAGSAARSPRRPAR